MATTKQTEKLALIEFEGGLLMPYDVAAQLFGLIGHSTPVKYSWGESAYKTIRNANELPKMRMFTVEEFATMQLNDDNS